MNTLRNNIAGKICNFTLNFIANEDYATFTAGAIQYGLLRAAEDANEREKYDGYWTPTREKKYAMFQKFLTKDEAIVLTTSDDMIYFITDDEIKVKTFALEKEEE